MKYIIFIFLLCPLWTVATPDNNVQIALCRGKSGASHKQRITLSQNQRYTNRLRLNPEYHYILNMAIVNVINQQATIQYQLEKTPSDNLLANPSFIKSTRSVIAPEKMMNATIPTDSQRHELPLPDEIKHDNAGLKDFPLTLYVAITQTPSTSCIIL